MRLLKLGCMLGYRQVRKVFDCFSVLFTCFLREETYNEVAI